MNIKNFLKLGLVIKLGEKFTFKLNLFVGLGTVLLYLGCKLILGW